MKHRIWALFLTIVPLCLLLVLLQMRWGHTASASPSLADTPPDGTPIILNPNRGQAGRISYEHEAVFGPQCATALGDPFSPISSTFRPLGYYTNPQYSPDYFTYRYRIDIPADYSYNVVRVELFDPDSYNASQGNVDQEGPGNVYVFTHTIPFGNPPTGSAVCTGNDRYRIEPCLLNTGENLDLNPFWFVRVDEIRVGNGNTCNAPSGLIYNNGHHTQTAFDLYYYGQTITDTTQMIPLANYMGRTDNAHDTDLRWVSPGGGQSYDQPMFVPANSGSFEVNLSTIPDMVVDPTTGMRSLYLDVTTLAGASENGFEIWAGPDFYTGPKDTNTSNHCGITGQFPPAGVPGRVNQRNVHIINCGYNAHRSQGVSVVALDYAPTNSNTSNPVNIPLTYIGPEYAGQSIYVTLFDSDSGAQGPAVFYFDTLAYNLLNPIPAPPADPVNPAMTDFYRAFSVNNTTTADPDLEPGQVRNCWIGNCNNFWITPTYRIDIPTVSPDCVDMQTTPLLCTPFYGGTLMARYDGGNHDSYTWHVELPELPLPDITQGCTDVFPIAAYEAIRSIAQWQYQDLVINGGANYPPVLPTYAQLQSAGHSPDHPLGYAFPGDTFLFIGQGIAQFNFSWLRWGSISQPDNITSLTESLTWPGNSFLFEESGDPSDTTFHEGDWVALNNSSAYGTAAATQLQAHIDRGRTLRMVIYRNAGSNGVQIAQLANFRILAYRLSPTQPHERWLLLQFVSYVDECGQQPILSVASTSVIENVTPAQGKIYLNGPFLFPITVSYATVPGNATSGVDYLPVSGTVTFAPGEIFKTFTVPILDDPYAELDEWFNISLSDPISATIRGGGSIHIIDDEPEPSIVFAFANQPVAEAAGTISVTIIQNGIYTGTVQADLHTADGTALAGVDYQPISLTLTFPPGVLTQTVDISLMNDNTFEDGETFQVVLSNPINGVFLYGDTETITILNDDAPPELSFAAAAPTVSENVSSGVLSVTVQLAPTSGVTATMAYSTTDGTATAGVDYQPVQGVITFTAGTTSAVIPIPLLNDTLAEGNEWFHLTLSDPVNGVITGTNPAQIFIVDDECLYNLYTVPGRVEAENFTCGGEGSAYHDTTPINNGNSAYRLLESVDVWDDAAASQSHYVGDTASGEWLVYTVEIAVAGKYDLWVAAASLQSGSCFRVEIDGVDVTGQVDVPVTGDVFAEVAAANRLTLTAGTHQIRLATPCGGANFDYLSFTPSPPDELFLPIMLRP